LLIHQSRASSERQILIALEDDVSISSLGKQPNPRVRNKSEKITSTLETLSKLLRKEICVLGA
jgi:hypothetical protein